MIIPPLDSAQAHTDKGVAEGNDQLPGWMIFSFDGVALELAALPLEVLTDTTIGAYERKNWAPHEVALRREITEFHLAQRLKNALQQELSGTQSAGLSETNADTGFIVRLDVFRIGLEPMGAWEYAFVVGVHLLVIDPYPETAIWEHTFVYACDQDAQWKRHRYVRMFDQPSNGGPYSNTIPFKTFIHYSDPSRPLKAFQGEPGLRLVQGELEDATARLSEEMVVSLKAAGF
jgi:hypothetical protein